MTSTPKKSTEAEDVLEFLNSLPDNSSKKGAFKAKSNKTVSSSKDDEDIMEFLDELEKTDINKKTNVKKGKEEEAVDDAGAADTAADSKPKEDDKDEKKEVTKGDDLESQQETQEGAEEEEKFIDPIASISNWWSSSGSQTVNSLWNNALEIKNKASEEATRFAQTHQIDDIESKLKSNLKDTSDQAKKFIDTSKLNVHDPLKLLSSNISNVLKNLNSVDEVLTIYLIHDLINFENLESIIYNDFKKVLKQVQGNIDLKVVKLNTASSTDEQKSKKKFNLFEGKLIDGDKLAFANLETSIQDVLKGEPTTTSDDDHVEVEVVENPTSKIFISILPVRQVSKSKDKDTEDEIETIDQNSPESFNFTVILKDLTHDITKVSRSQSFPIKWAKWLEGDSEEDSDNKKEADQDEEQDTDSEGIDPSEWVKEWIDDGIALTIGVLAQSYVVKRMGY